MSVVTVEFVITALGPLPEHKLHHSAAVYAQCPTHIVHGYLQVRKPCISGAPSAVLIVGNLCFDSMCACMCAGPDSNAHQPDQALLQAA